MFKVKRANKQRKKRRTSLDIEEEQSRTLYIRVPRTIKDADEIKSLFFGDFKVKLPRQSTRYCHVVFANVEEKIKNLKAVKKKLLDGKPIYAGPPKPMNLEKKKKPKQKKIVIPEPKDQSKAGKYIFVSNIPPGVKAPEVKAAFPGAVTVALLKGLVNGKRNAKLKMSTAQLCSHYVKDKANWPVLKEQKVCVRLGKKSSSSKNKLKKQKKTESLKIHDGKNVQKEESKEKKNDSEDVDAAGSGDENDAEEKESDSKDADSAGSDEDDESEEEDEEDEEESPEEE